MYLKVLPERSGWNIMNTSLSEVFILFRFAALSRTGECVSMIRDFVRSPFVLLTKINDIKYIHVHTCTCEEKTDGATVSKNREEPDQPPIAHSVGPSATRRCVLTWTDLYVIKI